MSVGSELGQQIVHKSLSLPKKDKFDVVDNLPQMPIIEKISILSVIYLYVFQKADTTYKKVSVLMKKICNLTPNRLKNLKLNWKIYLQ